MNEIILELDEYNDFASEATCEITKDLDHMSNLDSSQYYDFFHHYIYFSAGDISEHLLAIRVPGGTVGSIEFDDDYVIKSIGVDTNYVIQTYFRNVNKHIQRKYIGSKLIFPKEILEKFYSEEPKKAGESMTREETKKRFKSWCQEHIGNNASDEDYHMFNNIMALLEQEPCDDVISRKEALKEMQKYHDDCAKTSEYTRLGFEMAMNVVRDLPPVTLERPKGKWIENNQPKRNCNCFEMFRL